jgi:hypothetical protein
MRRSGIAVVALAALVLAACAGSRGDPMDAIRNLTGLAPPAETPAGQLDRAPDIRARIDSLLVSTVHVGTDHPQIPEYRLLAECSAAQCTLSNPLTGTSQTLTLSDLETPDLPSETVGTRHGITLMRVAGQHMGADVTQLGAWMDHGEFAVEMSSVDRDGVRFEFRSAQAFGDLTGTPLTGSATWLGLMVGTPVSGDDRGDRLVGTAALNYDMDAGGLDIAFSSIKNIDLGEAHSTASVIFTDVPIGQEGTFSLGAVGDRVEGGFHGPSHAEAAGIFERSNIIGAFGAKRQ